MAPATVLLHSSVHGAGPVVDAASAQGVFTLLWLVIALPALGAAVLLLGGRRTDRWGHWLGVGTVAASFLLSLVLFFSLAGRDSEDRQVSQHLWNWFTAGQYTVKLDLLYDQLSAVFLLLITGVGGIIHLYSVGYMEHDDRRRRFFGYLNLFVASMITLVLAGDYVGVFLGWEGVGLASYLLIGFWQYKPSAAAAAKKAFVINRVGDIGLSLGGALIFVTFGSTSFAVVSANADKASSGVLTTIGLLLLLAACGKSAQFPLQTWLLDAMEGPTPVSALIHAATMVTAGVYLIVRSNFIFSLTEDARTGVVIVGCITLLLGAIIGCAKDDIKKALAGSTMSQIGYMVLAAGLGPAGYAFAIFHLLTHGFFKANMFLGAGSVMHGTNDDVNMRHYGALQKAMPITFVTFAIGYLAIIGVPPFAGFWSKDKIIESAFADNFVVGLCALAGAGITAFYMTRLMLLTFVTEKRWEPDVHPHESPRVMTIPLIALAALSALGGFMLLNDWIVDWLSPVVGEHQEEALGVSALGMSLIALAVVAIGVAIAWLLFGRRAVPREAPTEVSFVTRAARAELYGDAFNDEAIVKPGWVGIRGLHVFDRAFVDGIAEGTASAFAGMSRGFRHAQNGFVRSYALAVLSGAALVLLALLAVNLMTDFPWLSVLIAVPIVGAVMVQALPRRANPAAPKQLALGVSLLTLVLGLVMTTGYETDGGMQFTEQHEWIKSFGAHYAVGVDGIGLTLVLLTLILTPVVLLASWNDGDNGRWSPNAFFAWILAMEGLAVGVFAATDVFLFYVFFEATLIPVYFLVGGYGGPQRARAAVKFLLYSLAGGLIMLAAVIGLYVESAKTSGGATYLVSELAKIDFGTDTGRWLFVGFFVAFAIKAPMFPVHTWLPDTTQNATPGTSVLLVSVLDKIGTFGMIRFCLELFPEASRWATPVVVTLAVISIVYGALMAIGSDNIPRLIGYTSISHFGFIVLGIFVMNSQGLSGANLYMFNHGLSTAALFLVTGFLISRRGSALISDFGGVEKVAPVLAGVFLLSGLSSLSLPGLSPFVSEFLVIVGAFSHAEVAAAFAVSGIVLAAIYILLMYQRTMTGPTRDEVLGMPDLRTREVVALAPVLLLIVVLGFFPKPLLSVINPSVDHTMSQVDRHDPAPTVAETTPEGAHE